MNNDEYTPTFRDLLSNTRALSSFIREWEKAIHEHEMHRQAGFDAGYYDVYQLEADDLSRACDDAWKMVTQFTRLFVEWWGEERAERMYMIANRYA